MTRWRYYTPSGMNGLLPPILDTDVLITVGSAQLALMLRARRSAHGQIVLTHGRSQNAERMAARRLVERELLSGPQFVGRPAGIKRWRDPEVVTGPASGLYVYTLTERGRTCWLRSKERGMDQ